MRKLTRIKNINKKKSKKKLLARFQKENVLINGLWKIREKESVFCAQKNLMRF